MENLRLELKDIIKINNNVDQRVEDVMTVFKKQIIDKLEEVRQMPCRKSSDYARLTSNITSLITEVKKL